MDRERLLESLYRFRDFLVAEGNTQVDLWPLANAIRWIAAEPESATPPRYEASKLAAHLNNIAEIMERPACNNTNWHQNHPDAIREAARRLSCDSLAPPPPDSVPVRIAVCVGQGSRGQIVEACGIDSYVDEAHAVGEARGGVNDTSTHECIVVICVPARQIPIVAGAVEAIDDPEATI